ncbi:hypothetical protein BEN30_01605 [Magnetovibrio blakemorei]|uniref:Uncharacterized protein n=1 Tax=Magnetovibrio blakemorei TaxID=28181 RepID=A0A1E5Q3U9_9PROT|nr:hypothetical protein BEN30_01605 [Magnetovibrio blakemorei]
MREEIIAPTISQVLQTGHKLKLTFMAENGEYIDFKAMSKGLRAHIVAIMSRHPGFVSKNKQSFLILNQRRFSMHHPIWG